MKFISADAEDYLYVAKTANMVFTLKRNNIGVYSAGKAFYLKARLKKGTEQQRIATFVTQSDGHQCELNQSCVDGKVWTNKKSMIARAVKLLKELSYA